MTTSVFIIGPSRSGTTVLSEALGKHSDIYQCEELHYYNLILPKLDEIDESGSNLGYLLLKEIDSAKKFFEIKNNFTHNCENLKNTNEYQSTNPKGLKSFFEELRRDSSIVIEQTPMNLFYIDHIKAEFNNALFIKMSRDVRALMASQKHRWKVGLNGNENIPKEDIKRVKYSGHPIIQLILLRAIAKQVRLVNKRTDVINVKFEDLVSNPQGTLADICSHINVDFEETMLTVSDRGSSHDKEINSKGFSESRSQSWKKNLTTTEIWLCQKVYPELVEGEFIHCQPKISELLMLVTTFPYYLLRALLLSKHSYGNLIFAIKRRLFR